MRAEEIVRALAAADEPSAVFSDYLERCVFCGAEMPNPETDLHLPDCMWIAAREWVETHPPSFVPDEDDSEICAMCGTQRAGHP